MIRMNESVSKIIWEIFAIVLAVLLALALDNYNENRKEKKLAEYALQSILTEVENNLASIKENYQKNQERLEQLILTRDTLIKMGKEALDGGISLYYEQTILSNGAWEMAKLTGTTQQLSPDLLQDLSQIHSLQQMYATTGQNYFLQIASIEFNSENNEKAKIDALVNLIAISGGVSQALIRNYETFLEEYDPENKYSGKD